MYDNAYESMESPSDEVVADDDMFDGWMIFQRRQREKDKKQQEVGKMSGSNHGGEVFVVAESAEDVERIQSLNDFGTRKQLQQKFKYIKEQEGPVQDKDLPDVKMALRRQAAEEFKNSIRGK